MDSLKSLDPAKSRKALSDLMRSAVQPLLKHRQLCDIKESSRVTWTEIRWLPGVSRDQLSEAYAMNLAYDEVKALQEITAPPNKPKKTGRL